MLKNMIDMYSILINYDESFMNPFINCDESKIKPIRELGNEHGFEVSDDICCSIYNALVANSKKYNEYQEHIKKQDKEMLGILRTLHSEKNIKIGRVEITNPTFKKWLLDGFIEQIKKCLIEKYPKINKEKLNEQICRMKNGDFPDFYSDFINAKDYKESDAKKWVAQLILKDIRGQWESDEEGNWGHYDEDEGGNEIFIKDYGVYSEGCVPDSKVSIKEAAFIYDLLYKFGFLKEDFDFEIMTDTEKFDRIKRFFNNAI